MLFLSRFARNERGNVAIFFGLMVIPLIALAGAAIDYSRAISLKHRIGVAIDAAALAAGSATSLSTADRVALAQQYYQANFGSYSDGSVGTPQVVINDDVITISATGTINTHLISVVGIHTLSVNATNEIRLKANKLELALVLDNTGSMSGSKLTSLKSAAHDLVNKLFEDPDAEEFVRIALVPFSASVNVGTNNQNASWMDTTGSSSYHSQHFETSTNIFTLYSQIQNRSWNGCVMARPAPYDTSDSPATGDPDSRWVPYFAPDEPDNNPGGGSKTYANNYMKDGFKKNPKNNYAERQEDIDKYDGVSISNSKPGPHYNCEIAPIQPLTNDKDVIDDQIDDMTANGFTMIPIGLAWGWRVLSSSPPFTEGVDYSDEDTIKAIVLLTDGQIDMGYKTNHNKSRFTGYGYVANNRLGTTNYNSAITEANNRTAQLCENIKNASSKGIIVYTVTFSLSNGPIKDLMRDCATTSGHYFDASNSAALAAAFGAIAQDLSNLRISK